MYEQRLKEITRRIKNNLLYHMVIPKKDGEPYPSIDDFFLENIIRKKIKESLLEEWDSDISLMFSIFTQEEKYTRFHTFLFYVYLNYQNNPLIDLQECWEENYQRFTIYREIPVNKVVSLGLSNLFQY